MLLITIIFEYKGNGDENKRLSMKKYLEEILLYLKDINSLILGKKLWYMEILIRCNAFKEW